MDTAGARVALRLRDSDIVGPTIHMNGTSADSLKEDLCAAYRAVGEAYEVLKRCAPNGRDFYVKSDATAALKAATGQHCRRLAALEAVRESLVRECDLIDECLAGR